MYNPRINHEKNTVWNAFKYGVFSGPYFPAFGLNKERYEVSLRIQSKCRKIRTKRNSVFEHISRSESFRVSKVSIRKAESLRLCYHYSFRYGSFLGNFPIFSKVIFKSTCDSYVHESPTISQVPIYNK